MLRALTIVLLLAGCASGSSGPLPPPPVDEARRLLDEVIDAGLDRDWDRLCANASGTCENELEGFEELAPSRPPRVVDVSVHQPIGDAESWTSGGVLFVLCGRDARGTPYESEVLVFDDGRRLLATAAVYWIGTSVSIVAPGEHVVTEPDPGPRRCP